MDSWVCGGLGDTGSVLADVVRGDASGVVLDVLRLRLPTTSIQPSCVPGEREPCCSTTTSVSTCVGIWGEVAGEASLRGAKLVVAPSFFFALFLA